MKKPVILSLILLLAMATFNGLQSQTTPDYQAKLAKMYKGSVDLIEPKDLFSKMADGDQLLILDTRTAREFEVSHIPTSIFVDYDSFNKKDFKDFDREKPVIVYCSVGYRSERIGEKLQKLGFTEVYNLYGGIFEWKNQGFDVEDDQGYYTENVHTYNEKWGQWLRKGNKVYE